MTACGSKVGGAALPSSIAREAADMSIYGYIRGRPHLFDSEGVGVHGCLDRIRLLHIVPIEVRLRVRARVRVRVR